jgi:hypothetical protein
MGLANTSNSTEVMEGVELRESGYCFGNDQSRASRWKRQSAQPVASTVIVATHQGSIQPSLIVGGRSSPSWA